MKKLFVVGLGPGSPALMTQQARDALAESEMLCGYHVYVELVRPLYPDLPVFTTPMTQEVDRCRAALEHAAAGTTVSLVCSGDAGVYGMAGLVYELSAAYPPVEIHIVPGVTAALSGAAVLGAPLAHDFAVISLSDLLTDWSLIEKRLDCAAAGDFCIALYNPVSRRRARHLQRACEILLRHKSPDTLCGFVRNIAREGEEARVMTLRELREAGDLDMFCTVFIGNAETGLIGGKMVTPRGYGKKYD